MPKEFMKERHTLEGFSPFNAHNSRFDAVLEPDKKQLTIVVRVQWVFPKKWSWTNFGFNSEATFKSRYREMVNQYWSGRYQLLLGVKGKRFPIEVNVVAAEGGNPHFSLQPQRMSSGRSYVHNHDCVLYAGATKVKANDLLMRLGFKMAFGSFGSDRTIYEQARALELDRIPSEVPFKANSDEMVDPNVGKEICETLRELHDLHLPMIPLRLKGFRLKNEEVGLSKRRAEALAEAIRAAKPPWQKGDKDNEPLIIKDGGVQKGAPLVHIKVGGRRSVMKKVDLLESVSAFPIAAHEFGHMLGLSDEYEPADRAARLHIQAANTIGIKAPEFGKNTASMMSMGDRFLPFHYITLREAVLEMIKKYRDAVADDDNRALAGSVPEDVTIGQTLLKKVTDFDRPPVFLDGLFKLEGGED